MSVTTMVKETKMKTVLVVEDDRYLRETLAQALESQGYKASVAGNPQEALELARERRPDLVVSDVHFAEGDGRELLSQLRDEEGLESCPFVLMTGDRIRAGQRASMDLGADDYLEKPFTLEEFVACVEARLRRASLVEDGQRRLLDELRGSVSMSLPHEFLTPLNGILGFAEVMRSERFEVEEVQEMAEMIFQSGQRLLRTVRNYLAILELNDMSTDVLSSENREWTGGELGQMVRQQAEELAKERGRTADLEVCCELAHDEKYWVGRDSLALVSRELVDNALKFSSEGSQVCVRLREEGDELAFMVTDCGFGMSDERVRQIGAFRQFDRSRYAQQGLGLGLTLVQKLLDKQSGRLQVESVPELGTTARALWSRV